MYMALTPTKAFHRRKERRKSSPLEDWNKSRVEPDVPLILKGAPVQMKTWQFIDDYKMKWNGNPPTRQQIAVFLECSKQRVDELIELLEEKEVIILDELLRPMIYWKEY